MSRLATFGCSFTYGQGLPDCHREDNDVSPEPSKFAWPSILAKSLSLECVNLSFPGRSNKGILFDVLRADLKPDDTVAFLWASTLRGLVFTDCDNTEYFLPSSDDSFMKRNYYTLHSDYDLAMQSILDIHHANMFLATKNIKVYNFIFDEILLDLNIQRGFNLPIKFIKLRQLFVDRALDGGHPGIRTQQNIANVMLDHITK